MDIDSRSNLGDSSPSSSCALCNTLLSSGNDAGDLESMSVCGDCNFLLHEDFEITSPDVYQMRRLVSRRRRFDSSESMESMFSHQFSQIISLARQNPSNVIERDGNSVDGDDARLVRPRRLRRVFSDTESEGFDSLYGESESNGSFRRYRGVHGEADTMSYSLYGGESDDGQSFLENENFGHPNGESEVDSDNDIDPMNAGMFRWNSEDEDESEWEEAEPHGNANSNGNGNGNVFINWGRPVLYSEVVGMGTFPGSIRQRIHAAASGELLEQNYVGNSGDYLDARGFEDLLEHLAENDSWRRGAPPASVSYINSMPRVTINEESGSMVCAICKDAFTVGTAVNQLPCFHLYHSSCILPWLSARNTCPLCRYELPTDDKEVSEIHEHELNDEDSSLDDEEASQVDYDGREEREGAPRNRWFFLAAPIVSIVGISLILWFGDSSAARLCLTGRSPCRRENNQRRWWPFF